MYRTKTCGELRLTDTGKAGKAAGGAAAAAGASGK